MKVVALFSGGMDSTALLYYLLDQGNEVYPVSVDYGQRHRRELDFASRTLHELNLYSRHRILDLSSVGKQLKGSSQTDLAVDVPHGHYAEESMKQTVVPNRNMLMLAAAGAIAISDKAEAVAYACHEGDHTIYPDCRNEFVEQMRKAFSLCDWHNLELLTPFVTLSKADIARAGHRLNVAWNNTWSCYEGKDIHCGACGTCVERIEAFQMAGVHDSTIYQQASINIEP